MTETPVKSFKSLAVPPVTSMGMEGPKIDVNKLFGREIVVHKASIEPSRLPGKENEKCLWLQISVSGAKHVVFSGSVYLMKQIKAVAEEDFPFSTTIVKKDNDSHQFT